MIEVMIVAFVIAGSLLVALAVSNRSMAVARQAAQSTQASFLLEEGVEAVRIMRDNDWDNIDALDSGTDYYMDYVSGDWTLIESPVAVGPFTRVLDFEDVYRDASSGDIDPSGALDTTTRLVNIEVSWQNGSSSVSETLSFYISDIFSTDD